MTPKKFYEFRLIEIMGAQEIKEHYSFIHPFYEGSLQRIYFSDDGEYMYERLIN